MKIVFHLPLRLEIYQTQETMIHQKRVENKTENGVFMTVFR